MALTLHGTVADNTAVFDRRSAKPIIINGDMAVAQRATSVTGYTGPGPYTTVDRYRLDISSLGTHTVAQTASAPDDTGLVNSFRVDCTTADASPGASDFMIFSTRLEGQDVQLFKKGTSYAEKITVAFWVKSNKTGTYIVEIDDNDNGRNINQAYTISSANTWEKKVLTFDGDTTGAFGNDNGDSFRLLWWLGAGSDFTSGTLETSWASTTNANRAVGQVNLADSTDNDWSITGIQLEVGEFDANSIAPFQHESYIENVERCWRYFEACESEGTNIFGQGFLSDGSGRVATLIGFHPKRVIPTVTSSAAGTFTGSQGVQAGGVATGFIVKAWSISTGANSGVAAGMCHVHLDTSGHSSMTDGQMCRVANTSGTNAFIKCDAEL